MKLMVNKFTNWMASALWLAVLGAFLFPMWPALGQTLPTRWRWSNPTPHGGNVYDMTYGYGLGLTVQVTERGQIFSSEDLVFWQPWDSGTTNALLGVTFLGQRLVVAGANGTLLYADSLENFQSASLSTANWFTAVAASSSLAVAVGDNAMIYSSSDGATWAADSIKQSPTNWLRSVAFGGNGSGTFVAVGEFGFIATRASNGQWTKQTSGTTNHLNKVAYVNGLFWAVGENGTVLTTSGSGNQSSWTAITTGATNSLYGVTGTNNTVLIMGEKELWLNESSSAAGPWANQLDTAKVAPATAWTYYCGVWEDTFYFIAGRSGMMFEGFKTNSTDTIWVTRHEPYRNWLWDMVATPNFYVAAGDQATVLTSSRGITWNLETVPDAATNSIFLGVGGDTNGLVVVGNKGTLIYSPNVITNVTFTNLDLTTIVNPVSTVGTYWNSVSVPTTNDLQGVARSANLFLVSGGTGTILTSANGTDWALQTTPTTKFLSSVAVFPGGYVATGDAGTILTSPNGTSWTARTSGTTNWVYRVRYLNNQLVAVGQNGIILTSPDGVTWTKRTSNTTKWLNNVIWLSNTYFVVGNQGTVLASADAVTWSNIGTITEKSLYGLDTLNGQLLAVGVEGAIVRSQITPLLSPIQFQSLGRATSQNLLLISGLTDQVFTLQTSTNLVDWVDGVTLELQEDSGTQLFLDSPDTNTIRSFYRAFSIK